MPLRASLDHSGLNVVKCITALATFEYCRLMPGLGCSELQERKAAMSDFTTMMIISIGRGGFASDNYMSSLNWLDFKDEIFDLAEYHGHVVFTTKGVSCSPTWGLEESFTVGIQINSSSGFDGLKVWLSDIAKAYDQDAIAVTVGVTTLVGPRTSVDEADADAVATFKQTLSEVAHADLASKVTR